MRKLDKEFRTLNRNMFIILVILFIILFIGLFFTSCQTKKSYEYLGCPCKIVDKKETPKGYQVTMINRNNIIVRILDSDLKERKIGEIIE